MVFTVGINLFYFCTPKELKKLTKHKEKKSLFDLFCSKYIDLNYLFLVCNPSIKYSKGYLRQFY